MPFVGSNFANRSASWIDPNMRMPYIMNWSGGFQWNFSQNWLLETTYQGSRGVRLLNAWDINQIPLNISSDPAQLLAISNAPQLYKPYQQFGTIRHYSNYGDNSYHGVTFRTEKRYSAGLVFNAFYTFSKSLNNNDGDGNADGITFYNRALEKGRANYDIRHRFVSVMTYDLPFGKGRRLMNRGGVLNAVLGGWDLAYTQTFQSGPPFTVGFAGSPNRYLPGNSRPNLVPGVSSGHAGLDHRPQPLPNPGADPVPQPRCLRLSGFLHRGDHGSQRRGSAGSDLAAILPVKAMVDLRRREVHSSVGHEQPVQEPELWRTGFDLQPE